MAIFLKAELETTIEGDGGGFISINQKNNNGDESVIWLSINQFNEIFNHQKDIIDEALGE